MDCETSLRSQEPFPFGDLVVEYDAYLACWLPRMLLDEIQPGKEAERHATLTHLHGDIFETNVQSFRPRDLLPSSVPTRKPGGRHRRIRTFAGPGIRINSTHHAPLGRDLLDLPLLPGPLNIAHLPHPIPRDDADAEQAGDNAERQRDDALGREAVGERRVRDVLAGQVEEVLRVGRRVARAGHGRVRGRAGGEVVVGDGEGLLED